MRARICKFASALIVVLSIGAAACGDDDNGSGRRTSLRAGLFAPSPFQSRLFSVEPATIAPEVLSGPVCGALPAFRTRFDVFMQTDRQLSLGRFGFEFRDRVGRRARPTVFVTSTIGATAHETSPVPMPTSLPVPIPGVLPFHGAIVSPPFGRVGLVLNFDCGFRADGTLIIDIESSEPGGASDVSQIRVPVG